MTSNDNYPVIIVCPAIHDTIYEQGQHVLSFVTLKFQKTFFYISRTENQQKVIFKSIQEKFSFMKNLHNNYNFLHFYIAPLFLCEKHEKLSSSTLKLEKSGLRDFLFLILSFPVTWFGRWMQPKIMVFLPSEFREWKVSYRLDLY